MLFHHLLLLIKSSGSELVAWLLETKEAVTKFEAISIGVKLLQNGLMHHVGSYLIVVNANY